MKVRSVGRSAAAALFQAAGSLAEEMPFKCGLPPYVRFRVIFRSGSLGLMLHVIPCKRIFVIQFAMLQTSQAGSQAASLILFFFPCFSSPWYLRIPGPTLWFLGSARCLARAGSGPDPGLSTARDVLGLVWSR